MELTAGGFIGAGLGSSIVVMKYSIGWGIATIFFTLTFGIIIYSFAQIQDNQSKPENYA